MSEVQTGDCVRIGCVQMYKPALVVLDRDVFFGDVKSVGQIQDVTAVE